MQKTFVLCRLFKRSNNGSSAPKSKYTTKSGPAECKIALVFESPAPEVQAKDHHPTTKECLHSEDSDGTTYADTIACKFERICFD